MSNSRTQSGFVRTRLAVGAACVGMLSGIALAGQNPVQVNMDSAALVVKSDSPQATNLVLKVVGPADFKATERTEHGRLTWYLPNGASDGVYNYRVYATTPDAGAQGQNRDASGPSYQKSGSFEVRNGVMHPRRPTHAASGDRKGWLEAGVMAVVDTVFPAAHAADLDASGDPAQVRFDDTSNNTPSWGDVDWDISLGAANTSSAGTLSVDNRRTSVSALLLFDTSIRALQSGANAVELGGGDLVVDHNDDWVGINTFPSDDFHLSSPENVTNFLISNPAQSKEWNINLGGLGLWVTDNNALTDPVKFQHGAATDSLVVAGSESGTTPGDVGFGTNTPAEALHVSRSDGSAKVLVDETSSTTATRDLLALKNNGVVLLGMENTNTGDIWDFSNRTSGFSVTLRGSGGSEMLVQQDGTFRVGPGNEWRFVVQPGGDATLDGTLTEGSSREIKENIQGVSEREVLAKLDQLPLSEWQYKEGNGSRHMGPMAEDFHATYGLGPDAKHIAPKDLAGVAMASAKALKDELEEKEKRIEELEAKANRVDELEKRLERLEGIEDRLDLMEERITE